MKRRFAPAFALVLLALFAAPLAAQDVVPRTLPGGTDDQVQIRDGVKFGGAPLSYDGNEWTISAPIEEGVPLKLATPSVTTNKLYADESGALKFNGAPIGGAGYDPNAVYVLRLAGGSTATHVNHGAFWPRGTPVDLGQEMLWEGWFAAESGGYVVSAGYGGGHELLWGFGGIPGGITGNIWNGSTTVSFSGNHTFAAGEWAHHMVGLTLLYGQVRIITWVNGVPDSIQTFGNSAAKRFSVGAASDGVLYIGGSDHSVWTGNLAFLRAWDRFCPMAGSNLMRARIPERLPLRYHRKADNTTAPCDFACDYTQRAGAIFLDTSPAGIDSGDGFRSHHHGTPINCTDPNLLNTGSAEDGAFPFLFYAHENGPYLLADATCPFGKPLGTTPAPTEIARTPLSVPPGALAFDSFQRANQTFAFQTFPNLGSTEGGSLGPLAWQFGIKSGGGSAPNNRPFGLLGGAMVNLGWGHAVAWVPVGTANQDVRITRAAGVRDFGGTALAFRVQDANNYWTLSWISGIDFAQGYGVWSLNKVVGGTITQVATNTLGGPNTWTMLRVVANGTTITCYRDDGSGGWVQLTQQVGQTDLQGATGAGVGTTTGPSTYLDGGARFKNFTVLAP